MKRGGRGGSYVGVGGATDDEDDKGILWKLPEVRSKQLGKVGPAFGIGVGCGFGLALGLIGGTGFGAGVPGLQLGLGVGAGCGIGLGFGYGVGRGIAYDHSRRYSNIDSFKFPSPSTLFPNQDEIGGMIDELVLNTKKLVDATAREVDKWRRP